MQEHIINYFSAEKAESIIFVILGLAAILCAVYLWLTANPYKAMAYPLVIVALIHIGVGASVYFRTDSQIEQLSRQIVDDPQKYREDEVTRMNTVMLNFKYYKWLELFLFFVGGVLTYQFVSNDTWYAVGVGLVIQSSLTLVLDLFAEKRGFEYLQHIHQVYA